MSYSLFKLFFSKIYLVWSESYFTKPLLEIVSFYCLLCISKARRNIELKKMAKVFCFSIFLLFTTLDLSYGIYFLIKPKYNFEQFVQYNEILNGLFTFIEFYTIYKVINFGLRNRRLKLGGIALGLILVLKEALFRFNIISFQNGNMDSIQFYDELSSGISYALFTLYFTLYYIVLYKQNIMSTFVTPTGYMIFCYVVLSLLFFPCSYYLIMQKNSVGYVVYAYHSLLASGICLMFRYNVLKHKSEEVNYLKFDI